MYTGALSSRVEPVEALNYMWLIWHCFKDVRSLLGTSWELPYWKMNGADLKMYSMQAIQSFPVVDVLRFSVFPKLRDLAIVFPASNDTQLSRRISSACHKLMPSHAGFRPQRQKISIAVKWVGCWAPDQGVFWPWLHNYINLPMNLKFQLENRKMSHESWLDGSTFKGITVIIWSKGSSFGKLGKQAKVLPRWYWQCSHQVMLLPIWWESTIVAGKHFGDEIFVGKVICW